MGKSQRDKGARGEREIVDILKQYGFTGRRTPLSGGMVWKGDLEHNLLSLHIEIKRQERLHLPAWHRQAEDDCPAGKVPCVVYRRNKEPWRISMPFDWFVALAQRYRYLCDEHNVEGSIYWPVRESDEA